MAGRAAADAEEEEEEVRSSSMKLVMSLRARRAASGMECGMWVVYQSRVRREGSGEGNKERMEWQIVQAVRCAWRVEGVGLAG